MQITLKIDGNDKTFVNDFVSARFLREAFKTNDELTSGEKTIEEQLDILSELVVRVFKNQFTLDELWDGIELKRYQGEISRVFKEILNMGGLEVRGVESEGK